jgi:uncharacterized membrane protein YphA (DoxX/SURF4 family)
MTIALILIAGFLGFAASFSAYGKFSKMPAVVTAMEHVGVPATRLWVLGLLEVLGAAGLAVGIFARGLGVAAAAGLVLYFAGAVISHLRKKDAFKDFFPALLLTVIAVATLLLELHR